MARLILEWSKEGRGENRLFPLTFCQIVALMLPHHSVVAGRSDDVVVAILFLLC